MSVQEIASCIVSPEQQATRILKGIAGLKRGVTPSLVRIGSGSHDYAEGLFALPFLTDIGCNLRIADPLGAGYPAVVGRVNKYDQGWLDEYFNNYYHEEMKPNCLWIALEVAALIARLEGEHGAPTKGTQRFLVVPARTHWDRREDSVYESPKSYRARHLAAGNLPLGLAHMIAIGISWPERFGHRRCDQAYAVGDQCTWQYPETGDGRISVPELGVISGQHIEDHWEDALHLGGIAVPVAYIK